MRGLVVREGSELSVVGCPLSVVTVQLRLNGFTVTRWCVAVYVHARAAGVREVEGAAEEEEELGYDGGAEDQSG